MSPFFLHFLKDYTKGSKITNLRSIYHPERRDYDVAKMGFKTPVVQHIITPTYIHTLLCNIYNCFCLVAWYSCLILSMILKMYKYLPPPSLKDNIGVMLGSHSAFSGCLCFIRYPSCGMRSQNPREIMHGIETSKERLNSGRHMFRDQYGRQFLWDPRFGAIPVVQENHTDRRIQAIPILYYNTVTGYIADNQRLRLLIPHEGYLIKQRHPENALRSVRKMVTSILLF
jgi:hypothetical protein